MAYDRVESSRGDWTSQLVDHGSLKSLAFTGVQSRGAEVADLAAWCDDWCIATGDARYCVLASMLTEIADWWEEQGAPSALLQAIDVAIKRDLAGVLAASTAASGAQLANELRTGVRQFLLPPSEWIDAGLATLGQREPPSIEPDHGR